MKDWTASKYAIEGFSESLAYELAMFGMRVKIAQPGLAPTTSFAANSGGRCDNLIPAAYADYAGRYLKSMQEYPTAYTSAEDVAEASMPLRPTVATSCCKRWSKSAARVTR